MRCCRLCRILALLLKRYVESGSLRTTSQWCRSVFRQQCTGPLNCVTSMVLTLKKLQRRWESLSARQESTSQGLAPGSSRNYIRVAVEESTLIEVDPYTLSLVIEGRMIMSREERWRCAKVYCRNSKRRHWADASCHTVLFGKAQLLQRDDDHLSDKPKNFEVGCSCARDGINEKSWDIWMSAHLHWPFVADSRR